MLMFKRVLFILKIMHSMVYEYFSTQLTSISFYMEKLNASSEPLYNTTNGTCSNKCTETSLLSYIKERRISQKIH